MSESESHTIDDDDDDNNNQLKTRRQRTREHLYARIYEEFVKSRTTTDIVYEKCLKRAPLPKNVEQIAALNAKFPLNGSQAISFWKELHSHRMRQFRRTYETTKPDAEYFRDTQWRWPKPVTPPKMIKLIC